MLSLLTVLVAAGTVLCTVDTLVSKIPASQFRQLQEQSAAEHWSYRPAERIPVLDRSTNQFVEAAWNIASPQALHVSFADAEYCFLSVTVTRNAQRYLNMSDSFVPLVNDSYCTRLGYSADDPNVLDLLSKNMPKGCALPRSGSFGCKRAYSQQNFTGRCGRTFADALPFHSSYWANLPPPLHAPGPNDVSLSDSPASFSASRYASSLQRTLHCLGIDDAVVVGDSVALQLQEQLFVAFRASKVFQLSRRMQQPDTLVHFHRYLPCGLAKVGIETMRKEVCLTVNYTECTTDAQAEFLKRITLDKVDRSARRPRNVQAGVNKIATGGNNTKGPHKLPLHLVILHAFGTHIWNYTSDLSQVEGIAQGVLSLAKELRSPKRLSQGLGGMLLLLEAPAQHFVYDVDSELEPQEDPQDYSGDYIPNQDYHRRKISGPCCHQPIRKSVKNDFRNTLLARTLNRLDPQWWEYVGWVSLYEVTAVSGSKTDMDLLGNPDCTHLAHNPSILDPLYLNMENEVLRLAASIDIAGGSVGASQEEHGGFNGLAAVETCMQ